jgi:hypothetical protein
VERDLVEDGPDLGVVDPVERAPRLGLRHTVAVTGQGRLVTTGALALDQSVEHRAVGVVERLLRDEDARERFAVPPHPGPHGGRELRAVDEPQLQREGPEDQVTIPMRCNHVVTDLTPPEGLPTFPFVSV